MGAWDGPKALRGKQRLILLGRGNVLESMSDSVMCPQEIKVNMIEAMKSNNTFGAAELQHGDIVCFQEVLPEEE